MQNPAPVLRTKNASEHEGDGDANHNGITWMVPQRNYKSAGRVGNRRTAVTIQINSVQISQNIERNLKNLRRLAFTPTTMKEHQLTLV